MVNLVLLLLTAGFFTLTIAASLLTLYKRELAVNQRVTRYFGENVRREDQDVKSKRRLFSGLISVYWEKGTEYLNRKISRADKRKIDNLLRDAGYPFKTAIDFRLFQLVLAIGGGLAMALLFLPIVEAKTSGWMLVITVGILGYRLPIFYLGKKSKARIKEINKGMPDFFDTVNLLLEAGMGLDLALADVSRKMKGPIADEFIQTIEDKIGRAHV